MIVRIRLFVEYRVIWKLWWLIAPVALTVTKAVSIQIWKWRSGWAPG